ncbi:MAG TPA: ABC transporter permease [archaeon]|nr:ABC transporter permease [archaeon]
MKPNFKALAFIAIILLAWEIVSGSAIVNAVLFPAPSKVFEAGAKWFATGQLETDVSTSFWRMLSGLTIGATLGAVAGLLLGRIIFLEEAVAPLFHILRALPPVALIPLMIVWLGIGDVAKILSIAFAVFFPVWVSVLVGAKTMHADYIKAAKVFSKSGIETFRKVVFPAVMPFIVGGVRIGIGVAFIMVFVSELAGASSGLGYFIATAQTIYRADMMIAGLIVLGLLAAATDYLFVVAAKRAVPWADI